MERENTEFEARLADVADRGEELAGCGGEANSPHAVGAPSEKLWIHGTHPIPITLGYVPI